ncbi:hypothetical protein CEUSTIGMA_g2702.t1 [Chlamydomonas eustigma]|uniref:Protein kinase domain-containing protein n=1 Tax=Chlamydomonas eustigma TaxID=1157962 RepID=A0A250WWP3_9CHLO|nr:hypothetical protein CEUSTIGMA_g2702.t1 [Chlamydomonas eustigma]|eukprot:GAX75257.1 hypothetical protein CEUSTIGMA_g2702.t1 [Chlamydomonas eustigma]
MTDSSEVYKVGRMPPWTEEGDGPSHGLSSLHEPSLHEPSFVSKISSVVKNVAISARRRSSILFDSDDSNHKPKLNRGPSIRQVGPQQYLKEEMQAARDAVKALDKAVAEATSYREKASKLLEEAHRALSRLEQASDTKTAPEMIVIACEVKVSARRGLTLVDVYGKMSGITKMATLVMRKTIYRKFDKVCDHLKTLLVSAESPPAAVPGSNLAAADAPAVPSSGNSAMNLVINSGSPSSAQQPLGLELRAGKYDRVYGLTYVPAAADHFIPETTCVWWAAGTMLEFYSEAGQSTTAFSLDKPHLLVTALAMDIDGNLWTGHVKGLIRVRRSQQWDFIAEDEFFASCPIRCIDFDDLGRAWIGDDCGQVKVLRFDAEHNAELQEVATLKDQQDLTPSSSNISSKVGSVTSPSKWGASLLGGVFGRGSSSAAVGSGTQQVFTKTSTQPRISPSCCQLNDNEGGACSMGSRQGSLNQPRSPRSPRSSTLPSAGSGASPFLPTMRPGRPAKLGGPIRAMLVSGGHAWISSGKVESSTLTLWSTSNFQGLDSWDCGTFGPCTCMTSMGVSLTANMLRRGGRLGSLNSGAGSELNPTSAVSMGLTEEDRTFSQVQASSSESGALADLGWRLLTGHENGQVILWTPCDRLHPLIQINDPGSSVRGIAVLDQYSLLVTGHASGELQIFLKPILTGGGPMGTFPSVHQSSVLALPENQMNMFGMFRPKRVTLKAHKTPLSLLVGSEGTFVTASTKGTIRLWHAAEVAAEAERGGIVVAPVLMENLGTSLATISRPGSKFSSEIRGSESMLSSMTVGSSLLPPLPDGRLQRPKSSNTAAERASSSSSSTIPIVQRVGSGGTTRFGGSSSGAPAVLEDARSLRSSNIDTEIRELHNDLRASSRHHPAYDPYPVGLGVVGSILENDDIISSRGSITAPNHRSLNPANSAFSPMNTMNSITDVGARFGSMCQTIDASELTLLKHIGTGAYGKVWLAEWTGCEVAVKELLCFSDNEEENGRAWADMQNEVNMLGSLSHPNIMRFMAITLNPPMIVMQYYSYGSLFGLLQKAQKGDLKSRRELTWRKRLEMLRDIAAGMHYLHTRRPAVIHGDLRSPNLLLDLTIEGDKPRFHVKIADFGLARMMNGGGNIMLSKTTNPRWTAPEVIRDSQIGPAGDVYSFAIIMWEMLTWQQPYEEMMSVQVIFSTVSGNVRPDVPEDDSELPGNPGRTLPQFKTLMERCWSPVVSERPSFKQVVSELQKLKEQEGPEPPKSRRGSTGPGAAGPVSSLLLSSNPAIELPGSGGSTRSEPPLHARSVTGGRGAMERPAFTPQPTEGEGYAGPIPSSSPPSATALSSPRDLNNPFAAAQRQGSAPADSKQEKQQQVFKPQQPQQQLHWKLLQEDQVDPTLTNSSGQHMDWLSAAQLPVLSSQEGAAESDNSDHRIGGVETTEHSFNFAGLVSPMQKYHLSRPSSEFPIFGRIPSNREKRSVDRKSPTAVRKLQQQQQQQINTSPFSSSYEGATASGHNGNKLPIASVERDVATSPFSAAQPASDSTFSAAEPASDSPFSAAQPTTNSPFLAAQPTNNSPFLTAQPTTNSPFSAAQPTSNSPFLTAQPTTNSPFLTAQPTTNSPFSAAQPTTNSPFSEAQPTTISPFSAAQAMSSSSPSAVDAGRQISANLSSPTCNSPFSNSPTCNIQPATVSTSLSSTAQAVDSQVVLAASSSSSSGHLYIAIHPECVVMPAPSPAPLTETTDGRFPLSAVVLAADINPTFMSNVMPELSFTPAYSPSASVHDQKEVGGWDDPAPAARPSPPPSWLPSEIAENVEVVSRGNSLPSPPAPSSTDWEGETSHQQNALQINREPSMFSSVASINSQGFEGSFADRLDQMKEPSGSLKGTAEGLKTILGSTGPASSDIGIQVLAGASTPGSPLKNQFQPNSPKSAAGKGSAFSRSSLPSTAATQAAAKFRGSGSKLGVGLSTAPISALPTAAATSSGEVQQQRVTQPGFITANEAARYLLKGRGAGSSLKSERRSLTGGQGSHSASFVRSLTGGQGSPSGSLSRGSSINSATGGGTAPASPTAQSRASSRAASPKQRRRTDQEMDLMATSSGVLPPEAGIRSSAQSESNSGQLRSSIRSSAHNAVESVPAPRSPAKRIVSFKDGESDEEDAAADRAVCCDSLALGATSHVSSITSATSPPTPKRSLPSRSFSFSKSSSPTKLSPVVRTVSAAAAAAKALPSSAFGTSLSSSRLGSGKVPASPVAAGTVGSAKSPISPVKMMGGPSSVGSPSLGKSSLSSAAAAATATVQRPMARLGSQGKGSS